MKTTTILLTALFALQVSFIFAGTDNDVVPGTKATPVTVVTSLAPVAPPTATFEDATTAADLTALEPVAPAEATFGDETANNSNASIKPVFPAEADFE